MKKIKSIAVLFIFLWLFFLPQRSFPVAKVKTMVFFFSLNESVPAYQNILEGFHSAFPEYFDEPYNLFVEYLDIGRIADNGYLQKIVNLYNEKFDGNKLDLIITVGPGTYSLLKKNGLMALTNTPTIAIDLEMFNTEKSLDSATDPVIAITAKLDIGKTLRTALDLFPDYRNVYVISGSSAIDLFYADLTRQAAQAFEGKYKFTFVSGISLDSTLQVVQKIPLNSMVIIPSYMTDVQNAPISTSFALNNIANQCQVPLFSVSDNFIKKGGIGGLVFSFNQVGREAGRISSEILKGKPIQEIVVHDEDFYQPIYVWKELKRWNLLNSRAIPSNSTFINKEFDFYSEYRWYLLAAGLFVIAQTVMITYFYRSNKRQKGMVKQKSEIDQLYRELVREERLSKMAELTASLSHELNQPLTAILYNAQAGKRFIHSEEFGTARSEEIFSNIIEDAKRAGGLIGSIRGLMKLDSREMDVLNLNALIKETIAIFNSEAIRNHIKISVILEDQVAFVFGDKIQLQQVILNFLSNAEQAMEFVDPTERTVKILQLRNTNWVTVTIKDSGPGIQYDVMERIFKPFITTRKNGFGIGLAISSSIIERHGGKIWAENVPGGGAKFSFRLKIV